MTALWWQDGRMEAGSTAVAGEAVHGVSDELATRLRLAVGRLSRRVRIDGGESVPPLQLSALVTVEGHGPLRLSELDACIFLTPSSMHIAITDPLDP